MTERQRLPDRRPHQVFNLEHEGHRLVIGVGRYDDGRLAEVFSNTDKPGAGIDTILKDSAILLSFALMFGADAAAIRKALSRSGPFGVLLDKIGGAA
jgi:ribonucleoside-diphosphate reductase alpha chain